MTTESLSLNQRVRDVDGFLGTVLYIGPVASAKNPAEIYAGVAWDDPTRGRHDGSVICRRTNALVRHFSPSSRAKRACGGGASPAAGSTATGGSFVRPSKLGCGTSLAAVLARRYVPLDAPRITARDNALPGMVALTSRGNPKQIELHGEMQIRGRQQVVGVGAMDAVSARGMDVARMFPPGGRAGAGAGLGHLVELDLAGNMLWEWAEVLAVARALPGLRALTLSGNAVRDPPLVLLRAPPSPSPSGIRRLVLNACNVRSWGTPLWLLRDVMPQLEELLLAHNDLRDVIEVAAEGGDRPIFPHMKFLDVSDCDLTSWEQVRRFDDAMPNLETLVLNENSLSDIGGTDEEGGGALPVVGAERPPTTPTVPPRFAHLSALQLSHNLISDWAVVDDMHRTLPALRSLRFGHNPLTSDMGASEARSFVVARCPALEFLNASAVGTRERADAERSYVWRGSSTPPPRRRTGRAKKYGPRTRGTPPSPRCTAGPSPPSGRGSAGGPSGRTRST